ncbi:M23 family metallopeptidase [Muricoccus radiodurans]|uniref:M23 family metallopeptidase n=1 Tax=Muricoccus radiodurans TaxID=2231721 RepID=UPI003CF8085B
MNEVMYLPLKVRPKESYHEAPRNYGANRSHGKRLHAGCDLYAPVGTGVYAVADGTVLDSYYFYLGTWAVEVDHGWCVVRYGEVQKKLAPGIRKGARIKAGDQIGQIGRLEGLKVSMLHFEMYTGKATGRLTQQGKNKYQRREDLMDPTGHLDRAMLLGGESSFAPAPLKWINARGFMSCVPA